MGKQAGPRVPRAVRDMPFSDLRPDDERGDYPNPSALALVQNKSLEELEVEAKRLYLCGRLNQFGKTTAAALLHQSYPNIALTRLNKLIDGWQKETDTITREGGAIWAREQLAILLQRSQLRATEYDMVGARGGYSTSGLAITNMDALDKARSEDLFQVQLIKQIVSLGDAMIEEEEDSPEQREGRFSYIEQLKETSSRLKPDGSREERILQMQRATYGSR